jgi:hypothetical protein
VSTLLTDSEIKIAASAASGANLLPLLQYTLPASSPAALLELQIWPRLHFGQQDPTYTPDLIAGMRFYIGIDESIQLAGNPATLPLTRTLHRLCVRGSRMLVRARSIVVMCRIVNAAVPVGTPLRVAARIAVAEGTPSQPASVTSTANGTQPSGFNWNLFGLPPFSTEYRVVGPPALQHSFLDFNGQILVDGNTAGVAWTMDNGVASDWRTLHPDAMGIQAFEGTIVEAR